jgi:hypothetical protein
MVGSVLSPEGATLDSRPLVLYITRLLPCLLHVIGCPTPSRFHLGLTFTI